MAFYITINNKSMNVEKFIKDNDKTKLEILIQVLMVLFIGGS